MAASTPVLRYKVTIDLTTSTKQLTFLDSLQGEYLSVYGYALNQVRGILRITSPLGVLYANSGFEDDDYSTPDVNGATPDWDKVIELETDDDGNVIQGLYTVEYKVSVNAGTSTITSSTYQFTLAFENPDVDLDIEVSNQYSTIEITDEATYSLTNNGTAKLPKTRTNKTITLQYPLTAGDPPGTMADVESLTDSLTAGPNIWSGDYNISVLFYAIYSLDTWSSGADKLVLNLLITGETTTKVRYDECSCQYYSCIKNIETHYLEELSYGNKVEADRLNKQMQLLSYYYMLYQMAVKCGQDTSYACSKIKEIVVYEDCDCDTTLLSASREIIPWAGMGGGGGGGTVQVWYDGSGVPSGALGVNDDYYLDVSTADVYKKSNNVWGIIGNIKGEQGDAGGVGDYGAAYLFSWFGVSGTPNNTSETTLGSAYDVPANTLTENGDCLHIQAFARFATNENGKTIRLYLEGNEILEYFVDSYITDSTKGIQIDAWVTKKNIYNQYVRYVISRDGFHGGLGGVKLLDTTINLAADMEVKITGQNSASSQNDIILYELKVLYIPYMFVGALPPEGGEVGGLKYQLFVVPVGGEDTFVVDLFTLNDYYVVFVDDIVQRFGHTRSGNEVVFDAPLPEGTVVMIMN